MPDFSLGRPIVGPLPLGRGGLHIPRVPGAGFPGQETVGDPWRGGADNVVSNLIGLGAEVSVIRLRGAEGRHPAKRNCPVRPPQGPEHRMRRSVDDYQNPAGDEAQQLSRIDGEETPLDLIVAFKPDLLVKGADY